MQCPHGTDVLISSLTAAIAHYRRASVARPLPPPPTDTANKGEHQDFASLLASIQSIPYPPPPHHHLVSWILNHKTSPKIVLTDIGHIMTLFNNKSNSRASFSHSSFHHSPWLRPSMAFKLTHPTTSSTPTHSLNQTLGFHGTSFENIWSILHSGLLNLTNTSLERTGAAFGSGIYLSTDLSVAFSFSKAGKGWVHSAIGRQLRAVLVCSISHHRDNDNGTDDNARQLPTSVSSSSPPDKYLIVQRSDAVRIEYILIYVDDKALEEEEEEEEGKGKLGMKKKKKKNNKKKRGAGGGGRAGAVVWGLLFLLLAFLVVMEHMPVIKRMYRSYKFRYPFLFV